MSAVNRLSFFGYVAAAIFSPGPNNITSMSNAVRYGFWGSLNYRLGISCGFFAVQALAALCSAALVGAIPAARPYMLALGAAYILWMAWRTFAIRPPAGDRAVARDNTFVSGLLLQFVNVKSIVFALTSMSAYAVPYSASPFFLLCFGALMTLCAAASIHCWAAFGAAFGPALRRRARAVNATMALLLVWCAVSLYL